MNQFNALHGEKPTDPILEWNSQSPEPHYKYRTSYPKTSFVVSTIMGTLDNHTIDNGDVYFHPSEFPIEYNYEHVPYPDTIPI